MQHNVQFTTFIYLRIENGEIELRVEHSHIVVGCACATGHISSLPRYSGAAQPSDKHHKMHKV